jgi:NitT/TauT family transport system substrate-binding protein
VITRFHQEYRMVESRSGRAGVARFLAAALLALALGPVSPAPAVAADMTTVRVGDSQPTFSFIPLDIGMSAGIFAKHGLTIEKTVFAGSAKLHQAIAANSIDVGLGAGPEFGFLVKGSPEFAVAAMADQPYDLALSVLKDGPIKTVGDLKGKNVSISTKGSLTEWAATELSKKQGWGDAGMVLVPLGSLSAQVAALKTHQIDGMMVEAGTAGRVEEQGVGRTLVTFGNIVKNFHIHVIFAQKAYITDHPKELQAFLAAWFESIKYMKTHKKESVDVASKVLDMSPALAGKLYDELMPMYNLTGKFNTDALTTIANSMVDMGEATTPPALQPFLTEKFLPGAK